MSVPPKIVAAFARAREAIQLEERREREEDARERAELRAEVKAEAAAREAARPVAAALWTWAGEAQADELRRLAREAGVAEVSLSGLRWKDGRAMRAMGSGVWDVRLLARGRLGFAARYHPVAGEHRAFVSAADMLARLPPAVLVVTWRGIESGAVWEAVEKDLAALDCHSRQR
jgi:hypothetical protein